MATKQNKCTSQKEGFLSFAHHQIDQLTQAGKLRTAERYAVTLNSFTRFRKGTDIPLDQLDSVTLMAYEMYLRTTGVCPNTSSYYMRNLRAVYNRAVEQGVILQHYPFRHVYTGVDKTVKRAVSIQVIRRIRDLDLSSFPSLDWERDLFMFSFYTRGMCFVDMAYLKKKNLQRGLLTYRRQKTGQRLVIKWEPPMQRIVDKYHQAGNPYLLPIVRRPDQDERRQYINALHHINTRLKKIGDLIGLAIPLTTYVARHGWASIAKSKRIPIATISEAMGHDSEKTTRIYLASLDTSVIDKANRLILSSL